MAEKRSVNMTGIYAIIVALITATATIAVAFINKGTQGTIKKEGVDTNAKEIHETKLPESISSISPHKKITCPSWYEGKDCQIEMREKFYGKYVGTLHNSSGQKLDVAIVLTPGSQNNIRGIHVFWCTGTDGRELAWDVLLSSIKTINIPLQHINNSPVKELKDIPYTDEGYGSLNGNVLTLHWKGTFPWGVDNFTAILNKI